MQVELTKQEIEVILNVLPRAWTEGGEHPKMVELKHKLMLALNRSKENV